MANYSVSTSDISKFEGSGSDVPTTYKFTITRDDTTLAGSVDWRVVVGVLPPVDITDFAKDTKFFGTAKFDAGASSVDLVFTVNADARPEPNEGFGIQIAPESGGAFVFSEIKDDDALHYLGTANSETLDLRTSTKGTVGDVSQGGTDKVIGSAFDDTVLFGNSFTNVDRVEGGDGFDRVILEGDYSQGITLVSSTLRSVEKIDFIGEYNYRLTIGNAAVAAGATLTIEAALDSGHVANVNAAAEADGHLRFLGGAGADVFTGGKIDDYFLGDFGADMLNGMNGMDTFAYRDRLDSPLLADESGTIDLSGADTLLLFQSGLDKIDLSALDFLGEQTAVLTKSTSGFTNNLSSGADFFRSGNVVAGVAVEYGKVGKTVSARVYVDADNNGSLGAGDMLIKVTGIAKGSIVASNFTF